MSYDTSIIIDTGGENPAEVEDVGNMTSNIGGMFRAAMPGPFGYPHGGRYNGTGGPEPEASGLPGLSGLTCTEALPIIERGLAFLRANEPAMRELEPDNGWGSYDGACRYLARVRDACARHPNATLAVNW